MPYTKVFAAKTGNASSIGIGQRGTQQSAFLVTTVGATPTVGITLEGSFDGVNWNQMTFYDDNEVAHTIRNTITITTARVLVMVPVNNNFYPLWRITLTANTNVTVDAWIGSSDD